MSEGVKTPLVGNGVWSAAVGADTGWFGPGLPPAAVAQALAQGRAFDFQTAFNLIQRPRAYEGITFEQLRGLADSYDLLRLVIETRKDQVEKLAWSIRRRGSKQKLGGCPDPQAERLQAFLQSPDQEHTWSQWVRALLEDLFVIDAPAIYCRRTKGGEVFSLDIIDGATIKRVLDPTGRTPMEGPAYQQVLKGLVAVDYTREELLYLPRNIRSNRVYGYSPVEQVLTTVNIALRRQLHQLSYYTEGAAPNLVFRVPKEWNPDQIQAFQTWWNSLREQRGTRFVPEGVEPVDLKKDAHKDGADEWLARIICYAFSVSPQALVAVMNRATAETAHQQALEEGLAPIMAWLKSAMDWILTRWFNEPDLEFSWDNEKAVDPLVRAQVDEIDVRSGVRTVNECREARGLEELQEEPVQPNTTPVPGKGEVAEQATATGHPGEAGGEGKPEPPAVSKSSTCCDLHKRKAIKPINRNRKSLKPLKKALVKTIAKWLKAQARPLAEALHAEVAKSEKPGLWKRWTLTSHELTKMTRDEALRILQASGQDWSELAEDLEPLLAAIAQDGAAAGLSQLGKATEAMLDQVNGRAVAWAEEHAAALVTMIEETTRERLAGDVAAALEEGLSVDDLASRLADSYQFSDDRAELIAQTELAFADVRGNTLAYAESGVVGGLEWVTANAGTGGDDRTCPDCDINNGAVVPMDENGNATEPFPSGATSVPAHPGCLCDLLPALNTEE